MSDITTPRLPVTAAGLSGLGHLQAGLVADLLARWADRRERRALRRAAAHLGGLSAHLLDDVGLSGTEADSWASAASARDDARALYSFGGVR